MTRSYGSTVDSCSRENMRSPASVSTLIMRRLLSRPTKGLLAQASPPAQPMAIPKAFTLGDARHNLGVGGKVHTRWAVDLALPICSRAVPERLKVKPFP